MKYSTGVHDIFNRSNPNSAKSPSAEVFSQKLGALKQLSRLGIPTSTSFMVTRDDYVRSVRHLERAKSDYWIVRVPLQQKHLFPRPAYGSDEIVALLDSLFQRQPSCQLLLTKLIPAIHAGIFVKTSDYVYSEHVPGALQSLARDGVTPIRVLLQPSGDVSHVERNTPEFFYNWCGSDLKVTRTLPTNSANQVETVSKKISAIAVRCPPLSIVEWVQSPNHEVYAVDLKRSYASFLGNYQNIYRGLRDRCLLTLPRTWDRQTLPYIASSDNDCLLLERPLYSHLTNGLPFAASRIVFRQGGLLAHLVVECSRRLIACMVSANTFDKLSGAQPNHTESPCVT
jgi:hypothetical protein